MNGAAGPTGQIKGKNIMFANTDHRFARFFDAAVVVAFTVLSLTLAGATALVSA